MEAEALRDLVRAREDSQGDLMRARHRLAKLLLCHEIRFEGPSQLDAGAISGGLAGIELEQRALEDYRGAVGALMIRREQLEAEIARALPVSPWARTARRLTRLRGIDTLTVAGLCAEIGDFTLFRHPAQVMSYLGGLLASRCASRVSAVTSVVHPTRGQLRDVVEFPAPALASGQCLSLSPPPLSSRTLPWPTRRCRRRVCQARGSAVSK